MSNGKLPLPADIEAAINEVTNKRARFVLDFIVQHGKVSTEDISKAGYDHPPRAAQDVRDLGFPLKTSKVKHSNGRSIAAYMLDLDKLQNPNMGGRKALSKRERQKVLTNAHGVCQICSSTVNLQVDHCIPYQVAGESKIVDGNIFQALCGSCNRKKSWACEHCPNFLEVKDLEVCRLCYWSGTDRYTHVATTQERRVDLLWVGKEETDHADKLLREAKNEGQELSSYIKGILKN